MGWGLRGEEGSLKVHGQAGEVSSGEASVTAQLAEQVWLERTPRGRVQGRGGILFIPGGWHIALQTSNVAVKCARKHLAQAGHMCGATDIG